MPVIHIYLLEGRTEEKLEKLVKEVAETVARVLEIDKERVTIILHETSPKRFSVGGVMLEKRRG